MKNTITEAHLPLLGGRCAARAAGLLLRRARACCRLLPAPNDRRHGLAWWAADYETCRGNEQGSEEWKREWRERLRASSLFVASGVRPINDQGDRETYVMVLTVRPVPVVSNHLDEPRLSNVRGEAYEKKGGGSTG